MKNTVNDIISMIDENIPYWNEISPEEIYNTILEQKKNGEWIDGN